MPIAIERFGQTGRFLRVKLRFFRESGRKIQKRYPDIDLGLFHLGGPRSMGILLTMDAEQGVEAIASGADQNTGRAGAGLRGTPGGRRFPCEIGMANFLGAVQGMSTMMANAKTVKDVMACYAIEYFEIASYNANAAAARELGDEDIANVCETIITEVQDMADWLEMQLPMSGNMSLLGTEFDHAYFLCRMIIGLTCTS
jgi:hypothetical protein